MNFYRFKIFKNYALFIIFFVFLSFPHISVSKEEHTKNSRYGKTAELSNGTMDKRARRWVCEISHGFICTSDEHDACTPFNSGSQLTIDFQKKKMARCLFNNDGCSEVDIIFSKGSYIHTSIYSPDWPETLKAYNDGSEITYFRGAPHAPGAYIGFGSCKPIP